MKLHASLSTITALLGAVLSATVSAAPQGVTGPTPASDIEQAAVAPLAPQSFDRYVPSLSWPLFAASDSDGDDQLSVFEANRALGSDQEGKQNVTMFRRMDRNENGYLEWAEFDEGFRAATRSLNKFTVQPSRPIIIPEDPTQPPDEPIVATLLGIVDISGDDLLSAREFRDFVTSLDLDNPPGFAEFDGDKSGSISFTEFRRVIELLPDGGRRVLRRYEAAPTTLPLSYRRGDVSRDGLLDRQEFELSLVALDPSLRRWSTRIMRDADFSGDNKLSRVEIIRVLESNIELPQFK